MYHPPTQDATLTLQRLLRDAKLFEARLGHVDGAGNTGTYLVQLVEGKVVAQSESKGNNNDAVKDEEQAEIAPAQSSDPAG